MIHTKGDLQQMQSLPLSVKILMTKRRIREWYDYWDGQVYISFSGGKDSTVLLHIARELYPDIEAVFVNTGLEYPEIQSFVKTFDNVTILRPKMRFDEVIKKYGYPIISKDVSNKICGARKGKQWAKKYVDGTANRKKSEKYGLTVHLCHWCHNEPPNGVHYNQAADTRLKQIGQQTAMREYGWTIDEFRKVFGKNYL